MLFDIRDYGAVNDGATKNTAAIQSAVDACAAAGGGRVLVSGGTYITGTVILKDNVELHLASDGVLKGSPDCADYPERECRHVDTTLLPRWQSACMLYAEECSHIAITGTGTIDGNGTAFVVPADAGYWKPYKRIDAPTPPRVVFFTGCDHVTVTDVTMQNQPAGWSYWIHDCDYVSFDRAKIDADVDFPNNDGIHINSSRNVTISNCCISCGDDSIIVRANNVSLHENKICEKVTVTNCNLTSHSGGIRVGWINDGVIRNCTFSNLVMTNTVNGVSIFLPGSGKERSSDEGREDTLIENILFSNIVMDDIIKHPIFIYIAQGERTRCAAIRDLRFTGIQSRSRLMPQLWGRADCPLKNIHITDCSFEKLKNTGDEKTPAGGASLDMKYVENLTLTGTSFTVGE